jgi:NAD(P)-dependent dehydrogenase (short-subunit alcohol dehydrogenase family)
MPSNGEPHPRGVWCPELAGKTAIVTGAGGERGIGRCIALELARQGVNIVLTDVGRPPDGVAEQVVAAGAAALPLMADVGDPRSADEVVAAAIDRFGGVDFLINNAGAPLAGDRVPVVDLPLDEWNRVLGVNLNGAFLMSQAAARVMIDQGRGGAIVNISSAASRQAPAANAAYAVSKGGINVLSRVMAMELAPHRVRVNVVLPGLTMTSRLGDLPEKDNSDAFVKAFVPIGFAGEGADIASMCTYLCSDMGRWITGQDIAVDGGTTWR